MKSFKEFINEDGGVAGVGSAGPTNTVGSGTIAGTGQPPGSKFGEPGVYLRKKKKDMSSPVMMSQFRRKPPKI